MKIKLLTRLNGVFLISSIERFSTLENVVGIWKFHNLYRRAIFGVLFIAIILLLMRLLMRNLTLRSLRFQDYRKFYWIEDKLSTTGVAFILLLAGHADTISYSVLRTTVSTLHSLTSSRLSVKNHYIIRISGLPQ